MADDSTASSRQALDIRPVPDPTVLTTQMADKMEAILRNLIKTEIQHRTELTDQTFETVQLRFEDLEKRTAEQKKDTKDALDAALAAQKEAVKEQTLSSEKSITKSETATAERIKTVETLLGSSATAINDKIDDLKDRVRAMESRGVGVSERHAERTALTGNVIAAAGLAAVIVAAIIGFLASHYH